MKLRSTKTAVGNIILISLTFSVGVFNSCIKKEDHTIRLKWNKAHAADTMEKNVKGLKWCLSFLGSEIAIDTTLKGINYNDSIIILNTSKLGFGEKAKKYLAQLNRQLKESEEYGHTKAIDLGRFIALTLGSSFHYYKITGVPSNISYYQKQHDFKEGKGYINNSGVSKVNRVISFTTNSIGNEQIYISEEIEPATERLLEFETAEIMPNGFVKYGIYNTDGILKEAASNGVTRAGKPAKCIWCHESGIQSIFKEQQEQTGYLDPQVFKDVIYQNHRKLRVYQDSLWKDIDIKNRRLHTLMEHAYINFMEPSVERLSREWGMPISEVEKRVGHLSKHDHEEFQYLKGLYHRKDIESLGPWKVVPVPESIREKSDSEKDYLTLKSYFNQVLNSLSLYPSEKK
ncbi:MAG: hypothetical protein AB3N14_14385 [Flavobacteriaceae bacterium]